ncbi:Toxin HigB-1 [Fundidesulfovibrio magnetotacticus]|uniref:Toxin HigB-1 n=2 Tax=Fundidesulfovibrio magnetotacticus TaxID=2730080 RepID=A0A6V8LZC7_9BACT|nr:Toxin HigB-1 [Fundidesulfovibrio magnetotacticus]
MDEACTVDVQRNTIDPLRLIQGFKCRLTAQIANEGRCDKRFRAFQRQAERRLRILDAADTRDALRMLPSNRFEALGGDRKGQYSIAVNMQWRICFLWGDNGPYEVEIVDYH